MKKLIILLFSIFISINSYSGIFNEKNICFETDGQNIVFLPNETNPYTGEYLCKYENVIGKSTTWYESGQKKSEANYKNGKLDGKSTWWNKRGQKIRQKEYKSGKLDGKLIEWFQFNGEIKREENYKNGKILF